jgi:hypothetical protein
MFIDDSASLDRRFSEMDDTPDPDGRFRIYDVFCHENTWRFVLRRLVCHCDSVLMDLRRFSPKSSGCIHELCELMNVLPFERVVLIADDRSDWACLRASLRGAWQHCAATSPNRLTPICRILIWRLGRANRTGFLGLLEAVCAASAGRETAIAGTASPK